MEGESPTLIIVNSIIIFNIIITIIIVYTPPVIPPVFAQMTHLENHSESIQKKLQQNWPVLCLYDCRCNIKFEISPFFPLDKKSWMLTSLFVLDYVIKHQMLNPLSASVALIWKPVNWFAVQINWLVSIWGQHWHLMG